MQNEPQVIKGYASAILTPNVNEFQRLCESQNIAFDPEHNDSMVMRLSQALGNVTVVQKGDVDVISNGKNGGSFEVVVGSAERKLTKRMNQC